MKLARILFWILLFLYLIITMLQFNPDTLVEKAEKYNLDPQIVAAMVKQESGGNTLASRYEPNYYDRYVSKKPNTGYFPKAYLVSGDTELRHRATSWGLMQVMGLTARAYNNFKNPYLTAMIIPEIGLEQGCKYLRRCVDIAKNKLGRDDEGSEVYKRALQYYNGSINYPPLIFEHIRLGRHLEFLPDSFEPKSEKKIY